MSKPSRNDLIRGYSRLHKGYDYSGINDTETNFSIDVYATKPGQIIQRVDIYDSNWRNTGALGTRDYGNYIKIKYNDGTFGLYAHLRRGSSLEVGTRIPEGQRVATIGNTGNSTGPHLHYERRNAQNINIEAIWEEHITDTQEIDQLRKMVEDLRKEVDDKNGHIGNLQEQVDQLVEEVKAKEIRIGEEVARHTEDLQKIASKLGTTDDIADILANVEQFLVIEEAKEKCLKEKRECGEDFTKLLTEHDKTLEELSLASGVRVTTYRGVKRALIAYLKLNQGNPPISELSISDHFGYIVDKIVSYIKRR